MIEFLQSFGRHVFRVIDHLAGIVMIPLIIEDAVLLAQVGICLGMREKGQGS